MGPGTSGTRLLRHPTHSTELFLGSPINPTCRIIFWPHCGHSINMLAWAFRWIGFELISDILTSALSYRFVQKLVQEQLPDPSHIISEHKYCSAAHQGHLIPRRTGKSSYMRPIWIDHLFVSRLVVQQEKFSRGTHG